MGRKQQPPVEVRSMNAPKLGWTREDALSLIAQGYTSAHAAQVSGFNQAYLEAQVKKADEERRARTVARKMAQQRVTVPSAHVLFKEPT